MNDLQNITILLVEDTLLSQKVLGLSIKAVGCKYDIASSGSEALNLFKQNHYDLIFMDIGLPDVNGLEVAAEIRKITSDVPIIVLTAYSDDLYRNQAEESGINDFVVKPITIEMCGELIKRFAAKKKAINSTA